MSLKQCLLSNVLLEISFKVCQKLLEECSCIWSSWGQLLMKLKPNSTTDLAVRTCHWTCKKNFSQDQRAKGTSHRINMQEELLTGWTCTRNFWQDNMHEELLIGSICTMNFSLNQHVRGTFHRITCTRNFSQDQYAQWTSVWINM